MGSKIRKNSKRGLTERGEVFPKKNGKTRWRGGRGIRTDRPSFKVCAAKAGGTKIDRVYQQQKPQKFGSGYKAAV